MTKDAPMFAPEQIGPTQSMTPEGFLLCKDVPIARTGVMTYGKGEVPAAEGPDGVIYITRPEEEVFSPTAMASFEGKPVTNTHPAELVTPETWRDHAVGTVMNVRRKENRLIADLLITDGDSIRDVRNGLREVSCGYDASYEQDKPGYAIQRDIVGNHVALVPKGRCGPSCAISDANPQEIRSMKKKTGFKDKILSLFGTRDEEGIRKLLDEMEEPKGDLHIHMSSGKDNEEEEGESGEEWDTKKIVSAIQELMEDKHMRDARGSKMKDDFNGLVEELVKKGYSKEYATKIAGKVAAEKGEDAAKDAEEEEKRKREEEGGKKANEKENREDPDRESYSGDSLPVLKARSEILSPGIRLSFPTGDAKEMAYKKGACDCKRQALKAAYATDQGKKAVDAILAGRSLESLSPATLDAVFMGASAVMGAQNNQSTSSATRTKDGFGVQAKVTDINKANREFWGARSR